MPAEIHLNDKLKKLWESRIDSILGIVAAGETDHREIASMASHIGVDYYGRFLIELIQNAEDQALRAGLKNTTVFIVRTDKILAVFNQGEPFDEKGIRSVTSAGISFKDPEVTIGNKGIGFKAVFQISDSPEIFSAYSVTEGTGNDNAVCFRLEKAPLNEECVRETVARLVRENLSADLLRHNKLKEMASGCDLIAFCLSEIERAAPFKFPLPVDEKCFKLRLEELKIESGIINSMTTIVVLPLLKSNDTQKVVDNAIDEFINSDEPANMLLFLKGINSIHIIDRPRRRIHHLGRKDRSTQQTMVNGAHLNHTRTFHLMKDGNITKRFTGHWWLARTKLGKGGDNPLTAETERLAIVKAVANIPGDNWDKVESVHSSIAFPKPKTRNFNGTPFGSHGKFCIGLPTMVSTGMPAWIDGPFHGNIPRTRINLDSQPYNKVIFDGAKDLFWRLIDHIKIHGNRAERVSVVLYFETLTGVWPLSSELKKSCQFEKLQIVLSEDGLKFLSIKDLVLPRLEDKEIFDKFFVSICHKKAPIFVLPAYELQIKAVKIFEEIAAGKGVFSSVENYIEKHEGSSLIEVAARHYRCYGPAFWVMFFEWLTSSYELEKIANQIIIPVGSDGIANAENKVFYRPVRREESEAILDEQEEEDVLEEFDESIFPEMNFFDETCLDVRQKNRRIALTPLARKIAPETGFTLVRRPRKPELINLVLAPHLLHLTKQDSREEAIAVIRLCADWLRGMRKKDLPRVRRDELFVPVHLSETRWGWVPPSNVYLGRGWIEPTHDDLLEKAYGDRSLGRLLPWDEFLPFIRPSNDHLSDWKSRMEMVGVASCPRIFEDDDLRKQAPLKSWSYSNLYVEPHVLCPIPNAKAYWAKYLEILIQRSCNTRSGQSFYIKPTSWIDGLESENVRQFVMELVLRYPKNYLNYLTAAVQRQDGNDKQEFPSFWVYSICCNNWSIVPTNDGYGSSAHTWLFGLEDQGRTFVKQKLVSFVPELFWDSRQILKAIGVYGPEEATPEKIINELHNIAGNLSGLKPEMLRSVRAFVRLLYQWLQDSCKRNFRPGVLSSINKQAIPLLQGEHLVAVDLRKKPIIYLDDEPERGRFIKDFDIAYSLPIKPNEAFKVLLKALQEIIGDSNIRRTSSSPLHIDFKPQDMKTGYSLFHYLQTEVGIPTEIDIARNIAVLIVYCGQQPMDPKKAEFKKIWELFSKTNIIIGDFVEKVEDLSVFDEMTMNGPTMFISKNATPIEVLESCWQLLGVGSRLLFTAYANSIGKNGNKSTRFFSECGVTESDFDEIDSIIRRAEIDNLPIMKPILFAVWKNIKTTNNSMLEFETEWLVKSVDIKTVSNWLNLDEKLLMYVLKESQWIADSQQHINLISKLGVSIEDWQSAREASGLKKVIFDKTANLYLKCKLKITALLKTEAVRRNGIDLIKAKDFIEKYTAISCPDYISTIVIEENDLYAVMYTELITELALQSNLSGMPRLSKVLARYTGSNQGDFTKKYRSEGSVRELMLYGQDEIFREQGAKEVLEGYLKVVSALAEKLGEPFSPDDIENLADVKLFRSGWWANRYAILRALRKGLIALVPITFSRLFDVRAFIKPLPWRDLWKSFPELGLLNQAESTNIPISTEKICGIETTTAAADADLRDGSHGEIGKTLIDLVNEDLDIAMMIMKSRNYVVRPARTNSGGGKRKTYNILPSKDKERIGLLGEAFVYETFRKFLPLFDYSCWVSENREQYGFYKPIEYGQGYDFEYTDTTGLISGCEGNTRCLIEVKATKEDGTGPFPMSDNEWSQAKRCYANEIDAKYIIVRVKNTKTLPEVSDIIIDPVDLWQKGQLAFWQHDILVYLE